VVRAVHTADDRLQTVFTDGVTIYERTTALPRFRWAFKMRVVADAQDRLNTLARSLPAGTLILDRPGPPGHTVEGRLATISVRSSTGDRLAADVQAQGGGYLVAEAIREIASQHLAWVRRRRAARTMRCPSHAE